MTTASTERGLGLDHTEVETEEVTADHVTSRKAGASFVARKDT
jgi:hypothetical protein